MLIGIFASFSNMLNAETLERSLFTASGGQMSVESNTLFYSFGQSFVSTTPSALQIGFLSPSKTTRKKANTTGCKIDPSAEEWTCVQFKNLKPLYNIGDKIKVDIHINVKVNPSKPVDLWVAMQHAGTLFFKISSESAFAPKAQAYKNNLVLLDTQEILLDFELIPTLGGEYLFYAVYVDKGKNPFKEDLAGIQRSELVIGKTKLANE
jgi:hypothetical protein